MVFVFEMQPSKVVWSWVIHALEACHTRGKGMKLMHAIGIFEQVATTFGRTARKFGVLLGVIAWKSMKCGKGRTFIYYSCHVDWAWRMWCCFSVLLGRNVSISGFLQVFHVPPSALNDCWTLSARAEDITSFSWI